VPRPFPHLIPTTVQPEVAPGALLPTTRESRHDGGIVRSHNNRQLLTWFSSETSRLDIWTRIKRLVSFEKWENQFRTRTWSSRKPKFQRPWVTQTHVAEVRDRCRRCRIDFHTCNPEARLVRGSLLRAADVLACLQQTPIVPSGPR